MNRSFLTVNLIYTALTQRTVSINKTLFYFFTMQRLSISYVPKTITAYFHSWTKMSLYQLRKLGRKRNGTIEGDIEENNKQCSASVPKVCILRRQIVIVRWQWRRILLSKRS